MKSVLVIGATGSVGQHVVDVALENGFAVHVLIRNLGSAKSLPKNITIHHGDLTQPESLTVPLSKVESIIFTHGAPWNSHGEFESVDYAGVRNVLKSIRGTPRRLALMTAIGVTNRNSSYNRSTNAPDWKRRSERLVRSSGHPYTIVRPGWFDYNNSDESKLVFLQGDKRWAGTPDDGGVSRRQIAEVLVASLECDDAKNKTFELVAEKGAAQVDFHPLFESLEMDVLSSLDGVQDTENMPLSEEPDSVIRDLREIQAGPSKA